MQHSMLATAPGWRLIKILIVDDHKDTADSAAMLLAGYDVSIAYNGKIALRQAEADPPDVLILDLGLPEMGGIEVCRQIREKPWGARMLIIVLSGWARIRDREMATAAGCDHYVIKPVAIDVLRELIADFQPIAR
jgi:DNA-binding response OmpR family regulator